MRCWNIIISSSDAIASYKILLISLMNPISGFSSNISQSCQPNCNGNSEKDAGDSVWKIFKKTSWTNAPLSVSEEELLPGQPYSSRTTADTGNYSGYRSLGWPPVELTGALSETGRLKPSAFHHCNKMTTHTCFFVWWWDDTGRFHHTAMGCRERHYVSSGKIETYIISRFWK